MVEAGDKSHQLNLRYKKPPLSSPSCGPGKQSSQSKMEQEMLSQVSFSLSFLYVRVFIRLLVFPWLQKCRMGFTSMC